MLQLHLHKQEFIERQKNKLLLMTLFMQHLEILITEVEPMHRWEFFWSWIKTQTYFPFMQS